MINSPRHQSFRRHHWHHRPQIWLREWLVSSMFVLVYLERKQQITLAEIDHLVVANLSSKKIMQQALSNHIPISITISLISTEHHLPLQSTNSYINISIFYMIIGGVCYGKYAGMNKFTLRVAMVWYFLFFYTTSLLDGIEKTMLWGHYLYLTYWHHVPVAFCAYVQSSSDISWFFLLACNK